MSTLDQYRQAKADYERLHSEAKKALIARAQEIAAEWCQIQKELRDDFGHKLTWNGKARLARKKAAVKIVPKTQDIAKVGPKRGYEAKVKRLEQKAEKLKAAIGGAANPTRKRALEDELYRVNDDIKLLSKEEE